MWERSCFSPKLLKDLRRLAPQASINAVSLPAAQIAHGLESGTVDLAMGYFPDLKKNNFFQQVLFTDGFIGLLRADHPLSAKKLNLKQFLQLEHAVVRAESRSEEVIEGYLKRKRIQRRVVLTTPHFASAPVIVAQSDLMVTVPEPLAYLFLGRLAPGSRGWPALPFAANSPAANLASQVSSRPAQPLAANVDRRVVSDAELTLISHARRRRHAHETEKRDDHEKRAQRERFPSLPVQQPEREIERYEHDAGDARVDRGLHREPDRAHATRVGFKRIGLFTVQHRVDDKCVQCVDQRDAADVDQAGKAQERMLLEINHECDEQDVTQDREEDDERRDKIEQLRDVAKRPCACPPATLPCAPC